MIEAPNEIILIKERHVPFDAWTFKWDKFEIRVKKSGDKYIVRVQDALFKDMLMPTLEGLPPLYKLKFPEAGILMKNSDECIETINKYKRLLPIIEDKLKELAKV